MSHPGAVRLVDRLEAGRLIVRRPTSDGRTVALHLKVAGQERRAKLLADCRTVLERALSRLSRHEQAQLVNSTRKTSKNYLSVSNGTRSMPTRFVGFVKNASVNPARWRELNLNFEVEEHGTTGSQSAE